MRAFAQSAPGSIRVTWLSVFRMLFGAVQHNPTNPGLHQFGNPGAKDMYRVFHGADSSKSRMIEVPSPTGDMFVIGRFTEGQYVPYGASKKHHDPYSHKFGDYGTHEDYTLEKQPLLLADANNNLFIARDKSQYYIDGRGIVG